MKMSQLTLKTSVNQRSTRVIARYYWFIANIDTVCNISIPSHTWVACVRIMSIFTFDTDNILFCRLYSIRRLVM